MKEEEMKQIGHLIARVLKDVCKDKSSKTVINEVKEEVTALAGRYTLYPEVK